MLACGCRAVHLNDLQAVEGICGCPWLSVVAYSYLWLFGAPLGSLSPLVVSVKAKSRKAFGGPHESPHRAIPRAKVRVVDSDSFL